MSRIVLLRPPAVFPASGYSAPITPPLAIAYLAANLLKHGHEVECIDALGADVNHLGISYHPDIRYRGLTNERIVARVSRKPDAIAVSTMFSQEWPHVAKMIEAVHVEFPDVPIIVGGEHASAASEYILTTCRPVKYVGLGEGEQTIVEFADFLDDKRKIEDVGGIQYLDESGKVVKNPPRQRIKEPDELPWPAWQLFDLEPYFTTGEGHGVERGRSMAILATRGCPYQCTFCSSPQMWTTRYVMRDAKAVVDEIAHYIDKYRATNIDFFDLTAVVKKEWILEFCSEITKRGLEFTWQLPSGTRSEALDEEVLVAMAAAGCMNVTYAPESGAATTLNRIKKRVVLPRLFESIRAAKRAGIFVKCNLIIGFPDETRREIYETLWCALRFAFIGVDDTGLYPFSPYPGSELYAELRKKGKIQDMSYSYYESLMGFMNLRKAPNYSDHVGPIELSIYRTVGMCVFYGLSYLLYPSRILRSIRNYRRHRSDTVFEERFFAYLKRKRLSSQMLLESSHHAEKSKG